MSESIQTVLKKYWGYSSFRPLQQEIIEAVLNGHDVLALLPTGGGKSICFQVPTMAVEGICLVISPLIALIKDQVHHLSKRGIPALAIYSGMPFYEVKKTLQNAAYGNYKFLYVSPERLETQLFLEYLPAIKPALIAVDEAHCISQWGHDFRPPYLRIANIRAELPGVPIIALTASATAIVQDEIKEKLLFSKNAKTFKQSFARPNLSYSVFSPESKEVKLKQILEKVPGSSIVYCRSRKQVQQVAGMLQMYGIQAAFYHAGLEAAQRSQRQEDWVNNKIRVMVCTNAFGMGIDKPDVRTVIHYTTPDCLENYYQEAGRAGRDGKKAYAVLLYQQTEVDALLQQAAIRYPLQQQLKVIYTSLMNRFQVAAGIGEGQSFDFDLASFCNDFKLDVLEATYGIQALAREDLISYTEMVLTPSTIVFTTGKAGIFDIEKMYPQLESVIKALLRSYEGIFDFPVNVFENKLAAFLKIKLPELLQALQQLHQLGVIQYRKPSGKPQIYLHKNRMYSDDFKINNSLLVQRKAEYEKRVNAVQQYLKTVQCREVFLNNYFSAPQHTDCAVCDNCIDKHFHNLEAGEFSAIEKQIQFIIREAPIPIKTLMTKMSNVPETKFWEVLQFLLAEEKLMQNAAGILSAPGKST